MKIVSASTKDYGGGAYIGAYRQFKALQTLGADVSLVVLKSSRREKKILEEKNAFFRAYNDFFVKKIDALPKIFADKLNRKDKALTFAPNRTVGRINRLNPDIIQIHNFNEGLFRLEDLAKLNAPIVWTLHDSWGLGGADHLPKEDDRRYILGFDKSAGFDLNEWVFKRKLKTFGKIKNLTVVVPSSWLYNKAKKSLIFKDRKIVKIPNAIDTQIFVPQDKVKARKSLRLPQNKLLVGFGALAGSDNKNKGFDLLVKSLTHLAKIYSYEEVELVIFGDQKNNLNLPFRAHFLGNIFKEQKLAKIYASLDVFVVPSRLENLPYAVMESMASNCPVVGFKVGGMPDLLPEYAMAKPFNAKDLAQKIQKFLEDTKLKKSFQKYASAKVSKEFNYKVVGKKYLDLYRGILG